MYREREMYIYLCVYIYIYSGTIPVLAQLPLLDRT